jgi:putative ABC transport system permease protein
LVISGRDVGVIDDLVSTPTVYLDLADVLVWTDLLPDRWSLNILGHASPERPGEAKMALMEASAVSELEADSPVRIDGLGPTADALATVRLTFLVVAAVALLVGTLGILNIGLVSLHERVEEIALRRATGALAVQVGLSVVMESVLAAVVAAFGAVALAWLAVPLVTPALFSNLSLVASIDFPYQTAIVGIAVAGAAGFAGGIIPAARASRIHIASVMRA